MSDASNIEGLPPIGTVIAGKYRLDRVLGVGGMGAVVAAHHLAVDESVAIKFLLGALQKDPTQVERFKREAWAASKIKSDHVVRVFDVGDLDGAPYLVMEYLEGTDLEAIVEGGPLPVSDAIDYVLQACKALAVAHKAGIIHRDLKPANLFMTRQADGSPTIKILDFGISKITSAEGITNTTALMGSPLFMAPEQLRSTKNVDVRADVWALGVIVYTLISGVTPFGGNTLPQICAAVMSLPPRPISEVAPHIPPGLAEVLAHAMAKSPQERIPSVAALAHALAPFASEEGKRSAAFVGRVLGQSATVTMPGPVSLPKGATVVGTPLLGAQTGQPVTGESRPNLARPRTNGPWIALGIVAAALIVVVGVGLSGDDPEPASPPVDEAAPAPETETPVATADVAASASSPAPAPTASASTAPSGTASATATPAAPPPATYRPKGPKPDPWKKYGGGR